MSVRWVVCKMFTAFCLLYSLIFSFHWIFPQWLWAAAARRGSQRHHRWCRGEEGLYSLLCKSSFYFFFLIKNVFVVFTFVSTEKKNKKTKWKVRDRLMMLHFCTDFNWRQVWRKKKHLWLLLVSNVFKMFLFFNIAVQMVHQSSGLSLAAFHGGFVVIAVFFLLFIQRKQWSLGLRSLVLYWSCTSSILTEIQQCDLTKISQIGSWITTEWVCGNAIY